MTEILPETSAEIRQFFGGTADFTWAASRADALPPMKLPEIAFAGRSNVGKSSLINALTGRSSLARTSHTPGRTQQLNFFDLASRLTLVDMPGYGYAAVSKQKVSSWTKMIHEYLRGRRSLARVYLLIDGRHGLKEADGAILDLLDQSAVSYQIVLTKTDEIKPYEVLQRIDDTLAGVRKRPAAHPEVIATSSRKGQGVDDLRRAIHDLLVEREGRGG